MNSNLKTALKETIQDLVDSGLKTSFTEAELKKLGVEFKQMKITPQRIKTIRKKTKCSQSVFAGLLNVSISSVRQWEQGFREPTGSTKVLLELIEKDPHILDYRYGRKRNAKR